MTERSWSVIYRQAWIRWPVYTATLYYALVVGTFTWIARILEPVFAGLNPAVGSFAMFGVMPGLFTKQVQRVPTRSEWWVMSLLCFVVFLGVVMPPWEVKLPLDIARASILVALGGGLFLSHLLMFSPWMMRQSMPNTSGASAAERDSLPSRYRRYWLNWPVITALALYAFFMLVFALLTHGLFADAYHSKGHPQRGFLVVLMFVMPWLFALNVQRAPVRREWWTLSVVATVIYLALAFATGEIHPASSRQWINSVAAALLYHLLMFSPWFVLFWLRVRQG